MHKILKVKAYEQMYGPHFNEVEAHKAVKNMINEDGTHGPHWTIEEAVNIAGQHNVDLTTTKYNKYDWFVALNMIYSDYYKVLHSINPMTTNKHFVDFTLAWLEDQDIGEGKMWYYYTYIMCDQIREEELDYFEEKCLTKYIKY